METVQIKVEGGLWRFYAHIEGACVCPECAPFVSRDGKTIPEAIDNLMEMLQERRAAKADPKDESFVYEIPYKWS